MILAFALAVAFLLFLGALSLYLLGEKGHEKARHWRMGLQDVRSFLFRPGLYYHPGHTWVMALRDGTVRVGLDDFGRQLVDGVRRVSLPSRGSPVTEGEVAIQLDCGKKRAKLVSPINGVVTAINEALSRDGTALERDPYGKGWLFAARVPDQRFTRLPTGNNAMEWLKGETGRLSVFLHRELGVTLADGGELVTKPPAMLNDEQWETLTRTFFHTA